MLIKAEVAENGGSMGGCLLDLATRAARCTLNLIGGKTPRFITNTDRAAGALPLQAHVAFRSDRKEKQRESNAG